MYTIPYQMRLWSGKVGTYANYLYLVGESWMFANQIISLATKRLLAKDPIGDKMTFSREMLLKN